jgi:hypothetical protein
MQLRRRYLSAITRDYCTWQANQKGESDYGQVRYRGDRSSARRLDGDVADARPGQPQGNASGLENNIEQVLLPLITAMLKDMQERDGARQGDREDVQQTRHTGEEGSVRR